MATNYSRIRAENQSVFIGTGQILGINSFQISNTFGAFPLNYLGRGNRAINQTSDSIQYADLNISSNFIQEDIFIQQTGIQPINCYIFQDKNNINTCYSLISGCLSNYSAKYATNQIPQINSSFRFFNNAGNITPLSLDLSCYSQISGINTNTYPTFNGDVADSNYINLTLDESNTNRVQDFTFNISFNRLPVFNVGTRAPKRIETIFPINVELAVNFEASDNFTDIVLSDFPLNKKQQTIELDVYSNRTNNLMANYSFNNFTLVSNDKSLNVDGNLIVSRKYVGELFSFNNDFTPFAVWDFGFVTQTASLYLNFGNTSSIATNSLDFGGVS